MRAPRTEHGGRWSSVGLDRYPDQQRARDASSGLPALILSGQDGLTTQLADPVVGVMNKPSSVLGAPCIVARISYRRFPDREDFVRSVCQYWESAAAGVQVCFQD